MPKLVKDDSLITMMDEMIDEDLAIMDEVIEEDSEVLDIIANPEKLIGTPYEMWTPEIKQRLVQIYGQDSEVLNRFIARKEIASVYELEKQVGGL